MEFFAKVIDLAVYLAGFAVWAIFIPQIRLLCQLKRSDSLSFGTVWGSFTIQTLILTQSALKQNWPVLVVMLMSVTCLGIVLALMYRYRRWPGGKS